MADIVERLRKWQHICGDAAWDDLSEAADEIERLRAALEHADKQLRGYGQVDPVVKRALTNGKPAEGQS